jgi:hypothetical protein
VEDEVELEVKVDVDNNKRIGIYGSALRRQPVALPHHGRRYRGDRSY